MPYTSYSYLTDADALAIKAYLFSLAPVHAAAPQNTLAFPFNQRWAMFFWSAVFDRDTRFEPNTQQSAEWNRGAYLAEALGHCGECHTPRNLAFALDNRKKFAGAITAGWRAFNITSDKATGLGDWRDEDIVAYLSTGHALGHGTASGPMGEAVDESLNLLAPEDIRALAIYLRSVPAVGSTDLPANRAPPASASHKVIAGTPDPHGKILFEGACVSCHGWTGQSPISPFATLTGAWAVNDPGGTNVAQVVISGTQRTVPGAVSMPAFGAAYSDAEIAALTNYVTARYGTKASAMTAQDVAELRKQTAQ
jgi:mono/diheme cytochrome c family protein